MATTALVVALLPSSAFAQAATPRLDVQLDGQPEALGGRLGLFVPIETGDGVIVYGDVYAGILPGTRSLYASGGAGLRGRIGGEWVLGGNLHYDATGSAHGHLYQQLAAGLELLSPDYEFRLEGTLPVGGTANAVDSLTSVGIENGNVAIRQGYEIALYGLKAEAGLRLPVFEDREGVSLKLFAEGFARGGQHHAPVYGVGARAELKLADFAPWPGAALTFGAGVDADTSGATSGRAFVRLSAPLGGSGSTAAGDRDPLYAAVRHDPIVATRAGAFGAVEGASFADGRAIGAARRIDSGSGDAAGLNALLQGAGQDSVILVDGEIALDDTLLLLAGQSLVGGQSGLAVVAAGSGKTYTLFNGGARGHLVADGASPGHSMVQLADDTTVAGLDITGGGTGIVGSGISGIVIDDVRIAETSGHGIALTDVDGATIGNVSYTSSTGCNGCSSMSYSDVYGTVTQAALFGVGLRNATISDFTSDGSGWGLVLAGLHDGTSITAATENVTIRDVKISNTSEEGMLFYLAENIDVSGFEIDNAGRSISEVHDGVVFMSSRDISLSQGSIAGTINGLMFVDPGSLPLSNGDITVADVTISDTFRAGVFFNVTSDVTLRNVEIVRPGAIEYTAGIYQYAAWPEAISNIVYDNVRVRDVVHADAAGITIIGDNEHISGTVFIENAPTVCNNWGFVTDTTLLINGQPLTTAC
jgi:hypothetical protein